MDGKILGLVEYVQTCPAVAIHLGRRWKSSTTAYFPPGSSLPHHVDECHEETEGAGGALNIGYQEVRIVVNISWRHG